MKILQICPRMPYPPHDGGAIAMYDVANGLTRAGHQVTVFALNTPKHHQPKSALDNVVSHVVTVDVDTSVSLFAAFLNLFKKIPYNLERFIHPKVSEALISLLKREKFDLIQIEGNQIAYYVDIIKSVTNTSVVMRAHNVESVIWKKLAKGEKNPFKKWYLNYLSKGIDSYELDYLNRFDHIITITERDRDIFREKGVKVPISIVPAGVDFSRFSENGITVKPRTLFMIGALNWRPNVEGIKWFLDHVWAEVSEKCPDLELHIAGRDTPEWLKVKRKNIIIHGYVASANAFIRQYDLMLVPLLSGSGMRLKIIEGMAMKKCIVSTYVGAEGIEYANNKNILIRDQAHDWIKLITAYYNGKIDTNEIGENAISFVKSMHDNREIIKQFESAYNELI